MIRQGVQLENMPDEQLMLLVRDGNKPAFDILVRRFQKQLYAFIYRFLGDASIAEDIFQDTFLRIYRSAATYEAKAKFSTFVYHVATNLCINEAKKRKGRFYVPLREEIRLDADYSETGSGAILEDERLGPDEVMEQDETTRLVRKALMQLPEPQRMSIILSYYQGMNYDEIAEVLNCSVGTIKSRVFRAKKALMEILEGNDAL